MTPLSVKLIEKLRKIASDIAQEKPKLHLVGLVHRVDAPPGDWDLLVSSDKLDPWNIDSIKYVVGQLKRRLRPAEMMSIATVVPLPRNNALVARLIQDDDGLLSSVHGLHPMDRIEQAVVIWPLKHARRPVMTGQ